MDLVTSAANAKKIEEARALIVNAGGALGIPGLPCSDLNDTPVVVAMKDLRRAMKLLAEVEATFPRRANEPLAPDGLKCLACETKVTSFDESDVGFVIYRPCGDRLTITTLLNELTMLEDKNASRNVKQDCARHRVRLRRMVAVLKKASQLRP